MLDQEGISPSLPESTKQTPVRNFVPTITAIQEIAVAQETENSPEPDDEQKAITEATAAESEQ